MKLHSYVVRYTTHKLIAVMNAKGEPYSLFDVEKFAKDHEAHLTKTVKAFTADDALVQLRASEGGSIDQPPFIFSIEPFQEE